MTLVDQIRGLLKRDGNCYVQTTVPGRGACNTLTDHIVLDEGKITFYVVGRSGQDLGRVCMDEDFRLKYYQENRYRILSRDEVAGLMEAAA